MTHRHPKAILFDLDDTILDYDSVADRSWKQVCDTVSPKLPGLGTQELFTAYLLARLEDSQVENLT